MSTKSQRRQHRQFWLRIHAWLGLSIGLIFVMFGLTGTVLAFYIEIDEWLNPEIVMSTVDTQRDLQSYETIFQTLKSHFPLRHKSWRLEIPEKTERMIQARYYQPLEKQHLAFAPLMVWVNPYTAEVVSSRFWGETLMTWIYDLHFTLLMDLTGRDIVVVLGLIILISLLSGIYLWWPKRKALRTAMSYKFGASYPRKIYDWHKLTGVYGFIFLLALVLTGVLLDFSGTRSLVAQWSPLYKPVATHSIPATDLPRISVDQAVEIATQVFPNATLKWIETPRGEQGSYRINFRQEGEPSLRFPKTNVWIDQYRGEVLSIRNVNVDSAGDTLLMWLHPLHSGEAFGLTGRIIICLSGLLPLILFSTGMIRWMQKRQAKRVRH